MTNPINIHTNTDLLSRNELVGEARMSKNRARIKLLQHMHEKFAQADALRESMETAYGYDPINDASFTGEFEAIGA